MMGLRLSFCSAAVRLMCCVCLCPHTQLLKENLVGQELDGKPWAPGNKTKDILIADYRWVESHKQRAFL